MPWHNGDFPPSYKNQPPVLRNKAVEIANELLARGVDEGVAIATGLKRARTMLSKQSVARVPPKQYEEEKSIDKKYNDVYLEYQDFQFKKRQYGNALHLFYEYIAEYNKVIDKLSVTEMELWRKEFNRHEKKIHDAANIFESSIEIYKRMLKKIKTTLKEPVSFQQKGKTITLQIVDGELKVERTN